MRYRKGGWALYELLISLGVMVIASAVLAVLYRDTLVQAPRLRRLADEQAAMQDMLRQLQEDVDDESLSGAGSAVTASKGRLQIGQSVQYRFEEGRTRRLILRPGGQALCVQAQREPDARVDVTAGRAVKQFGECLRAQAL